MVNRQDSLLVLTFVDDNYRYMDSEDDSIQWGAEVRSTIHM